MEELNKEDKEIATLEQMNALAVNPPADVVAATKLTPIEKVENDISEFSSGVMKIYLKDCETANLINQKIAERLELDEKDGGFTNNQLIAMQTNYNTTLNDKLSKTLGPVFQLMTAKQQNEYAAKQAEAKQQAAVQVNVGGSPDSMRQLNEQSSSELLVGMSNLNSFLNYFKKAAEERKPQQ